MRAKTKRFWSMLLTAVMMLTLAPVSAYADGDGPICYNEKNEAQEKTGVSADKCVEENDDGTYTITLSVEGSTTSSSEERNLPADIVLVIDTSGSMAFCGGELEQVSWQTYRCKVCDTKYTDSLFSSVPDRCENTRVNSNRLKKAQEAANQFVDALLEKEGVQIGLADFSGKNHVTVDLTDTNRTLQTAINGLNANHSDGTSYGAGLAAAKNILDEGRDDVQKFVVFLSDGEPQEYYYNDNDVTGTKAARELKAAGVTIFAIGIDMEDANALEKICTDDYCYTESADALGGILERLVTIIQEQISVGKNAVMKDVINTEKFTFVEFVADNDNDNVLINENKDTITWNIGEIGKDEKSISFIIKPKEGVSGEGLHTNSGVTLEFDSTILQDNVQFGTGAIGDPTVNIAGSIPQPELYKVTYVAGTDAPQNIDLTLPKDTNEYAAGAEVTLEGNPEPDKVTVGEYEYTFKAWEVSYTADGESVSIPVNDGKFTMPASNVTVTGTWNWNKVDAPEKEKEIQVSFWDDDTNNQIDTTQTVTAGGEATPPKDNQGKKIESWHLNHTGSEAYTGGFEYDNLEKLVEYWAESADPDKEIGYLHFYAKYAEQVTVTFHQSDEMISVDYGEGSKDYPVLQPLDDGRNVDAKAITVNEGEKVSAIAHTLRYEAQDQYEFKGWGIRKQLGTGDGTYLELYNFDSPVTSDIDLYPILEEKQVPEEGPETIYVRFWLTEGAEWADDDIAATSPQEYMLSRLSKNDELNAPVATEVVSKPNRAFVKWDGKAENNAFLEGGQGFTYSDMLEYAQEEDGEYVVNLFAVFKDVEIVKPIEKTKTIIVQYFLDQDGPSVKAAKEQTFTSKDEEGQVMSDIDEDVIPEGQHFDKWILANDFSEYYPSSILNFGALDKIVDGNYDEDGEAIVVFYAQFADNEDTEDRTVVVNFTVDPAKGTIAPMDDASYLHSNDTTVTFEDIGEFDGSQFQIPAIEAKDGYRFIGWRGQGADEIEWDADAETFGVSGLCYFPEGSNVGYASIDAVFERIEQEDARKIVVTFYDCGNCEILTNRCEDGEEVQHGYRYVLTEGEEEAFTVPGVKSEEGYQYLDWVNDYTGTEEPWYADPDTGDLTWDSVADIAYFRDDIAYVNIFAKCIKDGETPIKPDDPEKETYTVRFKGGEHGTIDGQAKYEYKDGERIQTVPDVTKTSSKYKFRYWTCDELSGTFTSADIMGMEVTQDLTFTAQWKKKSSGGSSSGTSSSSSSGSEKDTDKEKDAEKILTDEHFAYIVGYEDGKVRPMAYIKRGEVAVIYFRLLDADYRDKHLTSVNIFPDVKEGDWYNTAVSTLANAGIISGREDGKFHANDPITRAELATIVSKFADLKAGKNSFIDVSGHWAERFINSAATYGWISGYPDSTFRPDRYITRAEVMTLTNNVLERAVQTEGMHEDMRTWIDNVAGQWYYETVQEATNSHDYTRNGKDVPNLDFEYETWDDITRDPDWSRYSH